MTTIPPEKKSSFSLEVVPAIAGAFAAFLFKACFGVKGVPVWLGAVELGFLFAGLSLGVPLARQKLQGRPMNQRQKQIFFVVFGWALVLVLTAA